MEKNERLSLILAITGDALVWFPIAFTAALSLIRLAQTGMPLFDYLMPAELFPVALAGTVILLLAAFRLGIYKKKIGISAAVFIGAPLLGQAVAVVTGLASGETEIGGIEWAAVLVLLAVFIAAEVFLGIAGIGLARKIRKRK